GDHTSSGCGQEWDMGSSSSQGALPAVALPAALCAFVPPLTPILLALWSLTGCRCPFLYRPATGRRDTGAPSWCRFLGLADTPLRSRSPPVAIWARQRDLSCPCHTDKLLCNKP